MHLAGQGVFAIVYGLIRAVFLYAMCAFVFFDLHVPDANYLAAFVILVISSISFIGIGMMVSVLPLISPEKGTQLGFVAQGTLLVVSGVYYPVEVLPEWMQGSRRSPPRRMRSTDSRGDHGRGRARLAVGRTSGRCSSSVPCRSHSASGSSIAASATRSGTGS